MSNILFGKNTENKIKEITEKEFLMVFEGVDQYKVSKSHLSQGIDPIVLLTDISRVFNSKGEIRRLIESNAISINKIKIQLDFIVKNEDLLNNKYILIQKGKKHYIILCFE